MNVVVITEHRFDCTPDGAVWTQIAYAYPFWHRYLKVFDRVRVVARLRPINSVSSHHQPADGAQVEFFPIPHYIGAWQYLQQALKIHAVLTQAISREDALILRVPSQLANHLWQKVQQPIGLEVVGDPYDVFAPGALKNPLRPFWRWWFPQQLRQQCHHACAVAYVTQSALQQRYPARSDAFSTHYSSLDLPDTDFALSARQFQLSSEPIKLITVASLAQLYKAPDVLIQAVAQCIEWGLNLQLVIVGDGHYRSQLEDLTQTLKISDRVSFRGQLPAGKAIFSELDQADLFVLPSHQEGLPRAMIEAMARGLPCIGSTVGGIPELLSSGEMVPPGDVLALANKIQELVCDRDRMTQLSAQNWTKAQNYRAAVLSQRRTEFYQYLREATAQWQQQTSKH